MGLIFSHFKKKVSTKEKLEKIQQEITLLEEWKENTQQRSRKLVGNLVIYSFILSFISAIVLYFYYLPPTIQEKLLWAIPFVGFVLLIQVIKKCLTWYYGWKIGRNERKLTSLKEEKKNILDKVKETETYNVVNDILETFAPEQLRKHPAAAPTPVSTQRMGNPEAGATTEVRRRIIVPSTPQNYQGGRFPHMTPLGASVQQNRGVRPQMRMTPSTPFIRPNQGIRINSPPGARLQFTPGPGAASPKYGGGEYSESSYPPGPPMPRPVLPRERGILDRFVEYLVGDGPSNRYALVCRQCESHNGMALKDEFLYIAFRCAYCYYWNPARKQKPPPPKLETTANLEKHFIREDESSSEDEKEMEKNKKVASQGEKNSKKDTDDAKTAESADESTEDEKFLDSPEEKESESKTSTEDKIITESAKEDIEDKSSTAD